MTNEVRAIIEQPGKVIGVETEVLAAARRWRTRWEAAAVHECKRPPFR
jgi:hypothetical protein